MVSFDLLIFYLSGCPCCCRRATESEEPIDPEVCAPPPSYAECVNNQHVQMSPQEQQADPETLPPSYDTVRTQHYLEITHPIKSEIDKLKRFSESLNHGSHTNLSTSSGDVDSAIYCDDNDISFQEGAGVQSREPEDIPCCSYQMAHRASTNYAFTDEIGVSPNMEGNDGTYINQIRLGKVNDGFSSHLDNELLTMEWERGENVCDGGEQINDKQEDDQTEFRRRENLPVTEVDTKSTNTETEV